MKEASHAKTFRDLLVKHEEHSHKSSKELLQFAKKGDLVIRPVHWKQYLAKGYFRPQWDGTDISAEEFAKLAQDYFQELNKYNINAPVMFVTDEQNKEDGTIAEDVFAVLENVKQAEHPNKQELGVAFAALRAGLLAYYEDKLKSDESFVSDLWKDSQYVYGSVRGGPNALYLVDADPFIHRGRKALYTLAIELDRVVDEESAFFALPEYTAVREKSRAFLDKMSNLSKTHE